MHPRRRRNSGGRRYLEPLRTWASTLFPVDELLQPLSQWFRNTEIFYAIAIRLSPIAGLPDLDHAFVVFIYDLSAKDIRLQTLQGLFQIGYPAIHLMIPGMEGGGVNLACRHLPRLDFANQFLEIVDITIPDFGTLGLPGPNDRARKREAGAYADKAPIRLILQKIARFPGAPDPRTIFIIGVPDHAGLQH